MGRLRAWLSWIPHGLFGIAFVLLATSGLEILRAHPYFGPVGAPWRWVPVQGWVAPGLLRAGDGLGAARQLHLAGAWLLVLNALGYLAYLLGSGAWRARLRRWPHTAALGCGALAVASGLALWKPVQLHQLAAVLGGHDGARLVHFGALLGLTACLLADLVVVVVRARRRAAGKSGKSGASGESAR